MFAVFIRIILSWISPGQYNPATAIITTLTEPMLRPVRRLIPAMGGFDISPIFVIIGLGALSRLLMGFNQLGI
jgi:YggT family protein